MHIEMLELPQNLGFKGGFYHHCNFLGFFIKPFKEQILFVERRKLSYDPEKAMATHSSILAWHIPWMEEPGRLQSMGLLGIRQD